MSSHLYQKVRANPRFGELAVRRSRFSLLLGAIVLTSYYALMMPVAFAPQAPGTPISDGATFTIGAP